MNGARVLITGAAGGIGTAAAEEMRRRGARVVGLDLEGGVDVIACDVRDQDSVDSAVAEACSKLGGLDALINNAGLGTPQSAGLPPDDGALAVLDVNLLGPWRVTAAALPALREARGRVVNVASGLAYVTMPFATAYCMSKRGLVAYSDALRLEHGDAITVTTVYPGYIRTPIHDASKAAGIALEGVVPAEDLSEAAGRVADAALGPSRRDVATTTRGAASYALARLTPRRMMDRLTQVRMRQLGRRGHFDRSEMAAEFGERLRAGAAPRASR